MLKYTINNLKKIENIFKEGEYQVRYGKGNFSSGYCLLNDKQIIVINKLFDTEARITCLLDLLLSININEEMLEEKTKKHFHEFLKVVEQV